MVERNTRVRASQIMSILPDDMEATNDLVNDYVAKYDSASGKFTWVEMTGGAGGALSYKTTFVDDDLSSGDVITIAHGLDTEHPAVVVYDNDELQILISEVKYIDSNTIELDLSTMTPLTGTYKVRVIGAGIATGGFKQTFAEADLSSGGVLTVTHGLGIKEVFVDVYDNNFKKIEPDEITLTDTNNCSVDLSSFDVLAGTWTVIASLGTSADVGVPSILSDLDSDTKIYTEKNSDEDIIRFDIAGTEKLLLDGTALYPSIDEGLDLGKPSKKFGTAYFASSSIYLGTSKLEVVDGSLVLDGGSISGDVSQDDLNKVNDRVMVNAFRIAVNGSLSRFNMIDGVSDEYEDESGINVSSANESYEATDDFYEPSRDIAGTDANTVLMLHFNGEDTSTTFTDASASVHGDANVTGDAQVDTAQKKWGSGSLYCDSSNDGLYYTDSADWDFIASNSDDWTIDMWIKPVDYTALYDVPLVMQYQDGNYRFHFWYHSGTGGSRGFRAYAVIGGADIGITGATGALEDNNWHHIAWVKVGDKYGIYVDGTQMQQLETLLEIYI